jgi:hypothetical protein
MEFPTDVLGIIRNYSLPCMRFYRRYKKAMQDLEMDGWDAVREKLMTDDAEKIITALEVYVNTEIELRLSDKTVFNYDQEVSLDTFPRIRERWSEQIHINLLVRKNTKKRNRAMILLGYELVGKENYSRRWIREYEDEEMELEDSHSGMEYAFDVLDVEYQNLENAYDGVRMLYDN